MPQPSSFLHSSIFKQSFIQPDSRFPYSVLTLIECFVLTAQLGRSDANREQNLTALICKTV